MASALIDTVLRVLTADRPGKNQRSVHDALLELLFQSDCTICERVATTAETQAVHLLGIRGVGDDPLWLVSTLPAVPPGPTPCLDPSGTRLQGAGAVSGRADLVLKILAASRVPVSALRRPVCIAAIQGHPGQGDAALDLVETSESGAGVALVGGPTDLALWADHPGALTLKVSVLRVSRHRRMPPMSGFYRLEIEGRPAHHQAPSEGLDAIEAVDALLDELRSRGSVRLLSLDAGEGADRIAGRARLQLATTFDLGVLPENVKAEGLGDGDSVPFPIDDLYEGWWRAWGAGRGAVGDALGEDGNLPDALPLTAFHVGRLRTDLDRLEGTVTLSLGPGRDTAPIIEAFAEAAAASLSGRDELELELAVLDERPALACRERGSTWIDLAREGLEEVGLAPTVGGGPVATNAGKLTLHGVPSLVFGPGRLQDLYGDDEVVSVEALERACAFYEAMIRRWCT